MPHRSGAYMASHGASAASDVTPDLHLKMSKKIAQLTKVIYALNTKNDEHDAMVDAMKKSHDDEMHHLIAETKKKVDSFKTRLGVVSEQQQKIETLESIVGQERLYKEEAMSEFEHMKLQNETKLSQLREEYSDKILSMSTEMLSTKKGFDDRLKEFQAMRRKLEEDRDQMVDQLTSKHHDELDLLMKAHRVRYDEVVREKQRLEQVFKDKEAKIKEQASSSSSLAVEERKKLEQEYQDKVEKLKIFYEKEQAALRTQEAQSKEKSLKSFEERETQLKADWHRQERALKDRISELLNRQSDSEQELAELRDRITELQNLTHGNNTDTEKLSQQLEGSKRENVKALNDVRELQSEIMIYRKRCEVKGAEITRQCTVIGKLEATKLSQETSNINLKRTTNELNNTVSKLEKDYEELEHQYKSHFMESGEHIQSLKQSQLEQLKKEYEQSKVEAQNKLKTRLQSLSKELDHKWSENLSGECSQLRGELNEQHQKENRAALEELTRIKEQEMEAMRTELNIKIDTLRRTADEIEEEKQSYVIKTSDLIKDLQDSLEKRRANASNIEQQLRVDLEKQRIRYEEDAARLALSHNNKVKEMKMAHEEEMKNLKEMGDQQLKDLENKLQAKYQEDMSFNLQANKVALDAMKSQAERTRKKQIDELLEKYEEERETLRNELMRKQQDEMQQLNKEFETQMMAIKLQLQRTNEIMTRQEAEHQTNIDEITYEVEIRDTQLKELDDDLLALRKDVSKLEDELQAKGQEILTIRRETNSHIRKREEHLGRLHQREVDSLTSEHLYETQGLVEEFNRAKDLQNSKISALQLMLDEAEIRFRTRESRPEDTELLDTLKRVLAERELEMKKLLEKRYFQMELLNRETNFNKVFNASPHVGVINPLLSKTSVKKTVNKNTGILMSASRLDPIPNMPVHEKRLNNTKPLPPTPPKDGHRRTVVY
ncbi:hypothetical protein QZH41_014223 [Actinostola sp. cb2023]|nr:hypothetical protein QZH41_014223 [Actinostola sp. cb2023]